MDFSPSTGIKRGSAFTLVELLVATSILSLILLLTLQITGNTSNLWQHTRSRIDTFQEARAGFEAMTRKISQAMLNPYWDYADGSGQPRSPNASQQANFVPKQYLRQSDLHFISGQATDLLSNVRGSNGGALTSATQAIFFQAPLGYSEDSYKSVSTNGGSVALPTLLNVCGYFLEFGDDSKDRPEFLVKNANTLPKYRYRLMEMSQNSEVFSVYKWIAPDPDPVKTGYPDPSNFRNWYIDPLNDTKATTKRVLAENVIALVLSPKKSPHDQDEPSANAAIAPNYDYDSKNTSGTLGKLTRNQLPPLVGVTMIAIDEKSAARLDAEQGDTGSIPDLGLNELFKKNEENQFQKDLETLEKTLIDKRITYRVFSTDVSILQAKWSD